MRESRKVNSSQHDARPQCLKGESVKGKITTALALRTWNIFFYFSGHLFFCLGELGSSVHLLIWIWVIEFLYFFFFLPILRINPLPDV